MEALRVTRTEFDGLENSEVMALQTEDLGTFVDEDGKTAYVKVEDLLRSMGPIRPYLGWDKNVYPAIRVETVHLS